MAAAEHEFDVADQVRVAVESILKMRPDQLSLASTFDSLGIDSIIGMQLISRLAAKFRVRIAPAQFVQLRTVGELASHIESELKTARAAVGQASAIKRPEPVKIGVQRDARQRNRMADGKTANGVALDGQGAAALGTTSRTQQNKVLARPSSQRFIEFIRRQYGIDLDGRKLNTIEAAMEELLANHRGELARHYRISDTADLEAPEAGDASSSIPSERRREHLAQDTAASDVAIVGLSCRFPDAPNARVFWDNLLAGKNSIREISGSRWAVGDPAAEGNSSSTTPLWGALADDVDCFDPSFFGIAEDEAALMDPQERLLHQEVYRALQDAGLSVSELCASNTGVFVGYEYAEYEQLLRNHGDNIPNAPTYSSASPAYYLANRLSYAFDFRGPSEAINVNCASSAAAVNRAFYSLVNGESDLAVASGVCLNLFMDDYLAAAKYGLLSPDGTCGVFDDAANGYTRGEGVGVLVLKRLDEARRDNNRIYAVIRGCHQNNRGRADSLSDVKHEAITDVLSGCYRKAGITAEEVSYIEVDGYATKWGDSFEFEGIRNAFAAASPEQRRCALGCVKGNVGHLEPASAMASLIKVALSLFHGKFPPTITRKTLSEFIDIGDPGTPLYIADQPIALEEIRKSPTAPIRAGVNSFSDSGSNLHILLEEHIADVSTIRAVDSSTHELCVLSARDRSRLDESVSQLIETLSSGDTTIHFKDMVYTLQVGRDAMNHRLAIAAVSQSELIGKLHRFRQSRAHDAAQLERSGICYQALEENRASSIASLITEEMISMQLEQALRTQQWGPVALLWTHGLSIPWRKVWAGREVRTTSLPGYPFAKKRCWIDAAHHAKPARLSRLAAEAVRQPGREPAAEQEMMQAASSVSADDVSTAGEIAASGAEKIAVFLRREMALQMKRSSEQIATDKNFLELGMTSLGVVSLCRTINRSLEAKLSPTVFFRYPDIGKLSGYLAQTYPGKVDALSVPKQQPEARILEIVPRSGAESASRRVDSCAAEPAVSGLREQQEAPVAKSRASHEQILASVLWREDCNDGSYLKVSF